MESEHGRRHGGFFLIPAGALNGLGTGIIAGDMWTGMLMGLGAWFLIPLHQPLVPAEAPQPAESSASAAMPAPAVVEVSTPSPRCKPTRRLKKETFSAFLQTGSGF